MPKRPYLDLYVGDWLRDRVSGCSLGAQGLWLRLLFIMHDAPKRGHLCDEFCIAFASDEIARIIGCGIKEYEVLLGELHAKKIFSQTDSGVIFNRRMAKEYAISHVRATAARKRWNKKTRKASTDLHTDLHDAKRMQTLDIDIDNDSSMSLFNATIDKQQSVTRARKFVRPTVEEVSAYCVERANSVDPHAFVDFYEANGWVQGNSKKPLKNWMAAVRTWERRAAYIARPEARKREIVQL